MKKNLHTEKQFFNLLLFTKLTIPQHYFTTKKQHRYKKELGVPQVDVGTPRLSKKKGKELVITSLSIKSYIIHPPPREKKKPRFLNKVKKKGIRKARFVQGAHARGRGSHAASFYAHRLILINGPD